MAQAAKSIRLILILVTSGAACARLVLYSTPQSDAGLNGGK